MVHFYIIYDIKKTFRILFPHSGKNHQCLTSPSLEGEIHVDLYHTPRNSGKYLHSQPKVRMRVCNGFGCQTDAKSRDLNRANAKTAREIFFCSNQTARAEMLGLLLSPHSRHNLSCKGSQNSNESKTKTKQNKKPKDISKNFSKDDHHRTDFSNALSYPRKRIHYETKATWYFRHSRSTESTLEL